MKSNLEWKKWGEIDPLFAVATWEGKQRGSPTAWTDEEFYEIGKLDWADFLAHWQRYGLRTGSCLEIGAGAGRITRQLAKTFGQVTAADVSQHQLDYAKGHCQADNINFLLIDGMRYDLPDRSLDAIFSVHVFQHFESHDDAFQVFREIYRLLAPQGTFMIHLPLFELPDMMVSRLFRPVLDWSKRLSDLKARIDRGKMLRGTGSGVMRRLRFERSALLAALRQIGFDQIECCGFTVRSNGSFHDFIFGRRSS